MTIYGFIASDILAFVSFLVILIYFWVEYNKKDSKVVNENAKEESYNGEKIESQKATCICAILLFLVVLFLVVSGSSIVELSRGKDTYNTLLSESINIYKDVEHFDTLTSEEKVDFILNVSDFNNQAKKFNRSMYAYANNLNIEEVEFAVLDNLLTSEN